MRPFGPSPSSGLTLSYLGPVPTSPLASQFLFFLLQPSCAGAQCCPCPSPAHSPSWLSGISQRLRPRSLTATALQALVPTCLSSFVSHCSPQIPLQPLNEPTMMARGLCGGFFFCLPWPPPLGSLEGSSSLFQDFKHHLFVISTCVLLPVRTARAPAQAPGGLDSPFCLWSLLPGSPLYDRTPGEDPVPALAHSPPVAPSILRQSTIAPQTDYYRIYSSPPSFETGIGQLFYTLP